MEIVVVLDERPIAQFPRRQVIILDVVGNETAANGPSGLVAVGAEPLAVGLELLAGVDARQRRGNPARLQGIRGIGPAAAGNHAELPARLEDRSANLLLLLVGPPNFQARGAG